MRYELIGCGLHGHVVVGTDATELRPQDAVFVREYDGMRWFRCLRCDSWSQLDPTPGPAGTYPPGRDEIVVPLRGRPLRDRYVLRFIAVDRTLRFLVLAPIAAAIFLFTGDRARLHGDYTRILAALQSSFGVPVNNVGTSALNRLFALSTSELYLAGAALSAYAAVLFAEAVGLWFARRWAEYLTFLETGVFVPFEVYELTRSTTTLKVLALVINLAVLSYLLVRKRLFGVRGGGPADRAEREADSGWAALERATPGLRASAPPK
jgi:uncharacterized membrane protein (DUF2068 family)